MLSRFSIAGSFARLALALCVAAFLFACNNQGERKPLEEPAPAPRKIELPQVVGNEPGKLGQDVRFNIGAASDYYNALAAFEMKTRSVGTQDGGGEPPRERRVNMDLRQEHGGDFRFDLQMSVQGSPEVNGESGMTMMRKDGYTFFKIADQDQFMRRKASRGTELSRLIRTDALQGYLEFLQQTSKFVVGRNTHLGRPVRVYTVVESMPIDESPGYQGPDIASSEVKGNVWVDEGSGLVVKVDVEVARESHDMGQGPVRIVEHEQLEIVSIGNVTPIVAPENYMDGRDEYSTPEMEVPNFLGK